MAAVVWFRFLAQELLCPVGMAKKKKLIKKAQKYYVLLAEHLEYTYDSV